MGSCYGADLACSGTTCSKCGGPGEPCCQTSKCDDGLICGGNTCRRCGGPGEPCCPGATKCAGGGCCVNSACVAAGQACTANGLGLGMCAAGKCGGCGGAGEPCCPSTGIPGSSQCSDPATICQSSGGIGSVCARCGGPDQPCCTGNACNDGGCCVLSTTSFSGGRCVASGSMCPTSLPMTCTGGSCGSCGGVGQPCCTGTYDNFCTAPRTSCSTTGGTRVCIESGMLNACMSAF